MLYLLLVLILAWIIIIDRNVLDYLCLELSRLRIALITRLFKYRLLLGLKWDRFLMNRGYVPRKYAKMAKDILSKTSEKP
jgi:hypothetical protein